MNYFYTYSIKYYDSFDETEHIAHGITYGVTYAEAVENLAKQYGDEDIMEIISLFAIDSNYALEVPNAETLTIIRNHN